MLYNLHEYHRPNDVEEAHRLLQREDVNTAALAGGSKLVGQGGPEIEAVVDLSGLALDYMELKGDTLHLGAMVRLQTIVDEGTELAGGLLADTAHRMAGWHVRNAATVGGMLASGDIHAPLSIALAALGARVELYGQPGELPLWADLAGQAWGKGLQKQLLTEVSVESHQPLGTGYEQVARTPADLPILCAAAAAYPAGEGQIETCTAVGGLLRGSILVDRSVLKLDQDAAAADITGHLHEDLPTLDDYLGSAEYRRSIAPVIARRALAQALQRMHLSME